MEKLYLVYVNKIGENHKGKTLYEFIFNDELEGVMGENWDEYPASGRPLPPNESFVKEVGLLETDKVDLDVVQDSDTFSVFDSVDGVIALCFQCIDNCDVYPEHRLHFKFGESKDDVEKKLYEVDLKLKFSK